LINKVSERLGLGRLTAELAEPAVELPVQGR
jgi:hypothetical protein